MGLLCPWGAEALETSSQDYIFNKLFRIASCLPLPLVILALVCFVELRGLDQELSLGTFHPTNNVVSIFLDFLYLYI